MSCWHWQRGLGNTALRPYWASADDGPNWQPHIRSKDKRRKLANRFKDAKDPFRIVIVRDMWLTGFDAPCLHTMYADKPMQGHGRGMSNDEFGMTNGLNFVIRTSAFALPSIPAGQDPISEEKPST